MQPLLEGFRLLTKNPNAIGPMRSSARTLLFWEEFQRFHVNFHTLWTHLYLCTAPLVLDLEQGTLATHGSQTHQLSFRSGYHSSVLALVWRLQSRAQLLPDLPDLLSDCHRLTHSALLQAGYCRFQLLFSLSEHALALLSQLAENLFSRLDKAFALPSQTLFGQFQPLLLEYKLFFFILGSVPSFSQLLDKVNGLAFGRIQMLSCFFNNLQWHAKVSSNLKGIAGAGTTITQLIGRPVVFFIKSHRHILHPLMQHAVCLNQVVVRGYGHKSAAATKLVQYS